MLLPGERGEFEPLLSFERSTCETRCLNSHREDLMEGEGSNTSIELSTPLISTSNQAETKHHRSIATEQ